MAVGILSKAAEAKLLDSVKRAIYQVNEGVDANKALAKVASDMGYNPDFTNRMVEMYNTSRTLAHFKNNSGLEKAASKAADFPIADVQIVLSHMFPSEKRASFIPDNIPTALGEYGKLDGLMKIPLVDNNLVKEAAARGDPTLNKIMFGDNKTKLSEPYYDEKVRRSFNLKHAAAREAEIKKNDYDYDKYKREKLINKATDYFKLASHIPFAEVDKRVQGSFSVVGKKVMDVIWNNLGNRQKHEKRASEIGGYVSANEEPYKTLINIITSSDMMAKKATAMHKAAALRDLYNSEIDGRVDTLIKRTEWVYSDDSFFKEAAARPTPPALPVLTAGMTPAARQLEMDKYRVEMMRYNAEVDAYNDAERATAEAAARARAAQQRTTGQIQTEADFTSRMRSDPARRAQADRYLNILRAVRNDPGVAANRVNILQDAVNAGILTDSEVFSAPGVIDPNIDYDRHFERIRQYTLNQDAQSTGDREALEKLRSDRLKSYNWAKGGVTNLRDNFSSGVQSSSGIRDYILNQVGMGMAPESTDGARNDAIDPVFESKIKEIKRRVIIKNLMLDPVLSKRDPRDIVKAYNNILEVAPNAADSQDVLLSEMRRRLEGQIETFDVKQLTDVEKNIAKLEPFDTVDWAKPKPKAGTK